MKRIVITSGLLLIFSILYSQNKKDFRLIVKTGSESADLDDLLRFEGIDYKKINVTGKGLKNKFYIITASEYWEKELANTDTLLNTKQYGLINDTNELELRVFSKKESPDSVKFQIAGPRAVIVEKFKTREENTYSLRNPEAREEIWFNGHNRIAVLSYSLPYKDPEMPGYLFYCKLSSEGVPPEEWGVKYDVPHYIVFHLEIID